jgi:hypothetical protein
MKKRRFLCVLSYVDNGVFTPWLVGQQVEQLFVVELEKGNLHQELVPTVLPYKLEDILNSKHDNQCCESGSGIRDPVPFLTLVPGSRIRDE